MSKNGTGHLKELFAISPTWKKRIMLKMLHLFSNPQKKFLGSKKCYWHFSSVWKIIWFRTGYFPWKCNNSNSIKILIQLPWNGYQLYVKMVLWLYSWNYRRKQQSAFWIPLLSNTSSAACFAPSERCPFPSALLTAILY